MSSAPAFGKGLYSLRSSSGENSRQPASVLKRRRIRAAVWHADPKLNMAILFGGVLRSNDVLAEKRFRESKGSDRGPCRP